MTSLKEQIIDLIKCCNTGTIGEFKMFPGGHVTLYSSCFAAMTLHYLGELERCSEKDKQLWADYINSWQSEEGIYVGPELSKDEITSVNHNWQVVTTHLTAHVLPALDVLGAQPKHKLHFAKKYTVPETLHQWLNARDWAKVWLEGNNLLFVGQFLIHMRDIEADEKAATAVKLYLDWLNTQIDPNTGVWGTNGYCDKYSAVYGAYHQLLVYFFEEEDLKYHEKLVDTVLSCQAIDGSFGKYYKGGACEDIDAVDILVNSYKRYKYKKPEIRKALRRVLPYIFKNLTKDGGFVFRQDEPFIHMSIPRTKVPANKAHLFATWFRSHTIALIAEILTDEHSIEFEWKFNSVLSMGWHKKWDINENRLNSQDINAEKQIKKSFEFICRQLMRATKGFLKDKARPSAVCLLKILKLR